METVKKIKRSGGFRRKIDKYLKRSKNEEQLQNNSDSEAKLSSDLLQNGENRSTTEATEFVVSPTTSQNYVSGQSDSDENSTNDDDESRSNCLKRDLRQWSATHAITHIALKDLFQIINNFQPGTLPKDPRTLLQSPRTIEIKKIGNGEYWHHGLKNNLTRYFKNLTENKIVTIDVNFDGLPTYKSSKVEFWPILIKIIEIPSIPVLVVGIYCGVGKPSDLNEFLMSFVTEALEIIKEPIEINNFQLSIKIRAIICDSPARAFIKGKFFFIYSLT